MSQKSDLWVSPSEAKLAEIRAKVAQGYSFSDLIPESREYLRLGMIEGVKRY